MFGHLSCYAYKLKLYSSLKRIGVLMYEANGESSPCECRRSAQPFFPLRHTLRSSFRSSSGLIFLSH